MAAATSMRLTLIPFLFLLFAGCAAVTPDVPVAPKPEVVAPKPISPPPNAMAPAPSTPLPVPAATTSHTGPSTAVTEKKSAARGTETPVAATRPPAASASSVIVAKPATPPATAPPPPAAPPALDLNALKEQLKETKAIGVFTKLTLKNQVDDLLQQFRDFYQGKAKVTMAQLRRSYDLLLMKVLSLLQDADQKLASAIVASREAIWGLLADPKKFATLEG